MGMLKRSYALLLTVVMLAMTCFISIGYAALSDTLRITGTAKIEIPSGLFIVDIETVSTSNIDRNEVSFIEYSTTVNSTVSSQKKALASVKYKITVLNNTPYTYAYRDLYYIANQGSNSYVSTAKNNVNKKLQVLTDFSEEGNIVSPGNRLVFYVTYTIGKDLSKDLNLGTMLNYQFGINVDSIDRAADIVHSKFLEILNTTATYQELIEVLDDKFDGKEQWTSNYIGNVGNAVDNDMLTVETLFAGQLTMIINGQPQKAWVMIKHEDVDGNEMTGDDYKLEYNQYGTVTHKGCEMTLYMTVDDLGERYGWAPVYATVFTCDKDMAGNIISDWYKVGDSYYGQANIVGYHGENGGTGSFVTDNWKSYAGTYSVTRNYSYRIDADISIKALVQTVDQSTIDEFQRQLEKAEAIIANEKYAGLGITSVESAYAAASAYYTLDANGKAVANAGVRRVWLIPIMNELDHVLKVAQDAIDEIEKNP